MASCVAVGEVIGPLGGSAAAVGPRVGWRRPPLLSSAQIRPQASISYAVGGRFCHVYVPRGADVPVARGDRRAIGRFTERSRLKLLELVNSIDQHQLDPRCVYLVTLTYPARFVSPRESKRHLKMMLQRFTRAFGRVPSFWKLEPQKRGAPHYHLLVFASSVAASDEQRGWWASAWHEVAGQGDRRHLMWHLGKCGRGNRPCCEPIREWSGVVSYAAKYLGKVITDVDGWQAPGRYWGKCHFELLPVVVVRRACTRAAADGLRRWLTRWVEHQASGWFRAESIVRGTRRVYRVFGVAIADELRRHGFTVRAYHRRRRSRFGGGVRCFAPAAMVERMMSCWASHLAPIGGGS